MIEETPSKNKQKKTVTEQNSEALNEVKPVGNINKHL